MIFSWVSAIFKSNKIANFKELDGQTLYFWRFLFLISANVNKNHAIVFQLKSQDRFVYQL